MRKNYSPLVVLASVLVSLFLAVNMVHAQVSGPIIPDINIDNSTTIEEDSSTMNEDDFSTTDYSGEVTLINGRYVTLNLNNNSSREFLIPTSANITRDGSSATLDDIEVGDDATIRVNDETNEAVSVTVDSDGMADSNTLLIVFLILGGLVLLAAIMGIAMRGSRADSTLTTTKTSTTY